MGKNRHNEPNNEPNNEPYLFVNPYNFIPLGQKIASVEEDERNYTGVIEYSLKTITPLFIPNTSNDNAFRMQGKYEDHKSYDFFSYKDLSGVSGSIEAELPYPVIPGSEMRGMLRNNYEILTNSCMSAADDDALLSKRTQEKYKAGLLERREKPDGTVMYRLIEVKHDCLLRTKGKNNLVDDLNSWGTEKDENRREIKGKAAWGRQCYIQDSLLEGEKVNFIYKERESGRGKPLALKVGPYQKTQSRKSVGYILKGEKGPDMKDRNTGLPGKQNKHCAHVFREPANIENQVLSVGGKKEFSEGYLTSILDAVLTLYDKNCEGSYKEYREQYKKFKAGNGNQFFPVYFSTISYGNSTLPYRRNGRNADVLFLSPACITREVYTRKLSHMAGDKKSCEKSGRLCPACAMFGTFRENKEEKSVTSRVRVADLECMEQDPSKCFDKKPVTLQPLSQPKFNPEFYMKKPDKDAVFWTYEYYVDSSGNVHKNTSGINGRKFYWHHADFKMEKCTAEPSNLNKTVRPLKEGICFKGKIYFQNLSEKELNTLCYLVNAGDDASLEQKKHGYKLGAAKPLGFGSVAMHVDQVLLRRIEKSAEGKIILQEVPYEPNKDKTLVDSGTVKDFEKMTDFYVLRGENVSYPRRQENGNIFEWFAKNHTGYRYNKAENKNKETEMPQSRNMMLFKEYLQPMTPKTVSTNLDQKIFNKDRK